MHSWNNAQWASSDPLCESLLSDSFVFLANVEPDFSGREGESFNPCPPAAQGVTNALVCQSARQGLPSQPMGGKQVVHGAEILMNFLG